MRHLLSTVTACAVPVAGLGVASITAAGTAEAAGPGDGPMGCLVGVGTTRQPYHIASRGTGRTLTEAARECARERPGTEPDGGHGPNARAVPAWPALRAEGAHVVRVGAPGSH